MANSSLPMQWSLAAVITILRKDLRRFMRDRGSMLYLIAMPLVLMAAIGYANLTPLAESQDIQQAGPKVMIAIVSRSPVAPVMQRTVTEALQRYGISTAWVGLDTARAGLGKRWPAVAVFADSAFDDLHAGVGPDIQLLTLLDRRPPTATVGRFNMGIAFVQGLFATGLDDSTVLRRVGHDDDGIVEVRDVTADAARGFNHVVPAYVVMFALFGISAGAATVLEERGRGTYHRLLAAPIARGVILIAKAAHQFLITLIQTIVLLVVAMLVFGVHPHHLMLLGGLVVALGYAAASVGMLLVSLVSSSRQMRILAMSTILGFSAIGGSWWPIWSEPHWLQGMARLSVTYWAMSAFNGILLLNAPTTQIAGNVLALVMYGTIALGISYARFSRLRLT